MTDDRPALDTGARRDAGPGWEAVTWWHFAGAAILAVVLVVLITGPAYAHADIIRSDPAPGSLLPRAPAQIRLWFSEDVNPVASRIVVWNQDRAAETEGDARLVPDHARELVMRLKPLPPGSYLVLWTSVSAEDGHLLRGYFSFSVIVPGSLPSLSGVPSTNQQIFPDAPGLIALLAHWIEMLAAVTWVGTAALSACVYLPAARTLDARLLEGEHHRTRFLIRLALLVLAVASTLVVLVEGYGIAGNDWGQVLTKSTIAGVFADQYGQVWVARQVLVLVAVFVGLHRVPGLSAYRSYREHVQVQTIVGLGYLYAMAVSGHAASVNIGVLPSHHGHLVSVAILADWLHWIADALWLGGQIYIMLVLIPTLRLRHEPTHTGSFLGMLHRFSPFAYASVVTYALSGVFAAKVHIPSWYAFFNSVYGRALLVKVILIGSMMLVSAVTVYLVRPRLRHAMPAGDGNVVRMPSLLMHRLLWWLRVSPLLGAGVLLATSVMFTYPVPPGLSPPGPGAYHAKGGPR